MAENPIACPKKRTPRDGVTPFDKMRTLAIWKESVNIQLAINTVFPFLEPEKYQSRRRSAYEWKKEADALAELARRPRTGQRKKQRPLGVGTRIPHAEEQKLVVWINRLRGEGVPISSVMLAKKAVKAAASLSLSGFIASKAWQKRFRARHRFSLRAKTRQGQGRPADAEAKAEAFGQKVREKIVELGVDRVYNADQTAVMFEYIPKRTIEGTGSKTVWIRCASGTKTRATVMLLADSLGNKQKPTVILKTAPSKLQHVAAANVADRHGFGVRTWSKVKQIQTATGMRVYGNKSGWWNERIHLLFLKNDFASRENPEKPVLLLLDEFSGHWTPDVRKYAAEINVHLMKVPGGLTAVCQPADISWMKPFKDQIQASWVDNLMDQLERHVPANPFKLEASKVEHVCEWVVSAWDKMSLRSICSGFERAHMQDRCSAVAELLQQCHFSTEEVDSEDEFDA